MFQFSINLFNSNSLSVQLLATSFWTFLANYSINKTSDLFNFPVLKTGEVKQIGAFLIDKKGNSVDKQGEKSAGSGAKSVPVLSQETNFCLSQPDLVGLKQASHQSFQRRVGGQEQGPDSKQVLMVVKQG